MSKCVIVPLFVGLICLTLTRIPLLASQSSDPILLKLPFRIVCESQPSLALTAADLSLEINERDTAIHSLLSQRRSFIENQGRRQIILAFISGHPAGELGPFLDYFYRDLLQSGDNLLLCSPLGRIPLPQPSNIPTPFPKDARKRLEEDLETFAAMLRGLEKQLAEIVLPFHKKISEPQWKKQFSRYEREVDRLQEHLLAAVLMRLEQELGFNSDDGRCPWLILIGESLSPAERVAWPFFEAARLAGLSPDSLARVKELEKRLDPASNPSLDELTTALFLRRVVLMPFTIQSHVPPSSRFSSILDHISRKSGISPIPFTSALMAGQSISAFEDTLFELVYPFDGTSNDKHYRIKAPNGDMRFAYPATIQALAFQSLKGPDFSITEAVLEDGLIRCRFEGISPGQAGGRLRVRLRILDDTSQVRFDEEKEMVASQSSVTIRLPIPPDIKGYISVIIEARDLNNHTSQQKRIYGKI